MRLDAVYLLALLGVVVAVASALSIQILNASALAAFEGSARAVSGEAQLTLVGRGPWLDDRLLGAVLSTPGVKGALPLVRLQVALGDRPADTLEVVGTDLFSPAQAIWSGDGQGGGGGWRSASRLSEVQQVAGWVAVTPRLAASRGWRVGSRLPVSSGSRRAVLTVGALVDFRGEPRSRAGGSR